MTRKFETGRSPCPAECDRDTTNDDNESRPSFHSFQPPREDVKNQKSMRDRGVQSEAVMVQTSFANPPENHVLQRLAVCACLALRVLNGSAAWSQHSETPKNAPVSRAEAKASDRLHEVYLREVSDYEFSLNAESQRKLELHREPVFRFTAGPSNFQGEVYIWTDQGVGAVVGCVWTGRLDENHRRRMFHEFHSLSPRPLVAGSGGGTRWHSEETGIQLEAIPDAPPPADNEARRLTQMRNLARSFSADMTWNGVKSDLRLLPQPLYRYEPTNKVSQVIDGALFAYVLATGPLDPEVFLVIEARRSASETSWQFALARFTNREATVKHQGKPVWRAEAGSPGIFDGVTTKRYGVFSVKLITDGPAE